MKIFFLNYCGDIENISNPNNMLFTTVTMRNFSGLLITFCLSVAHIRGNKSLIFFFFF